jgi:hypothetical protein
MKAYDRSTVTMSMCPIYKARKEKLSQGLEALAKWVEARASGDHSPDTTLTLLQRKVAELEARTTRAGREASNNLR